MITLKYVLNVNMLVISIVHHTYIIIIISMEMLHEGTSVAPKYPPGEKIQWTIFHNDNIATWECSCNDKMAAAIKRSNTYICLGTMTTS